MRSRFPLVILLTASCAAQITARMDQVVQSSVADRRFMGSALVARGPEVL